MSLYSTASIQKHIDYLQGTLIPDLLDSGSEMTAGDFKTCVDMLDQLLHRFDQFTEDHDASVTITRQRPSANVRYWQTVLTLGPGGNSYHVVGEGDNLNDSLMDSIENTVNRT